MKTTLMIYILMGFLFLVPLIGFNIRKIWVKKAPDPVRFNLPRFIVILLLNALILTFLVTAYQQTMKNRPEIAAEKLAIQHGDVLLGQQSWEDFKAFVKENGTENAAAVLEEMTPLSPVDGLTRIPLQISKWCIPKYWVDNESFEQVPILSDENPVYMMYRMQIGDEEFYYVFRMRKTEEGWKYDWFGQATDGQIKVIKCIPETASGIIWSLRTLKGKFGKHLVKCLRASCLYFADRKPFFIPLYAGFGRPPQATFPEACLKGPQISVKPQKWKTPIGPLSESRAFSFLRCLCEMRRAVFRLPL